MAGLMRFPRNVFEWSNTFNDDYGYEAYQAPKPTDAPPGSPEKRAVIIERLSRGQRLWSADDTVTDESDRDYSSDEFTTVGDERYGAIVGVDVSGGRHRYALWQSLSRTGPRMLYIPAVCGHVDSFDKDPSLEAIRRHADDQGASLVCVASLYSARVHKNSDIKKVDFPITSVGMLWLRWLARFAEKTVICWGEATMLGRNDDVLWMLSRTSPNCQIYAAIPCGAPPSIDFRTVGSLFRYDYRKELGDRHEEEYDAEECE